MSEGPATTTRQEILATALALFTAQGYDGTSLRQIADRLGFTKAALYYHFPAKEHLAIELTRPWLDAISNLITVDNEETTSGHEDDVARRTRLLSDYVDIFIAHHAVLQFLSQDVAALRHPDVGKRAHTLVMALQDALAGSEADEADRIRVTCALSVVHAIGLLDTSAMAAARPIVISAALAVLGVHSPVD